MVDGTEKTTPKENSISLKKFHKDSSKDYFYSNFNDDKKEVKPENISSSTKSNSTLSLHIAAYENFVEAQVAEKAFEKKGTITTSLQNPKQEGPSFNDLLEFPRQQKSKKFTKPEVQQFAASQRLFAPNQEPFSPSVVTQNSPPLTTMETVSDLQLRQIRKFRAFPAQNLPSTDFGRKLVGISSRYGFAVIAGPENRLISVKTSELQALQSDDFKETDVFPKREMDFFNLQAEIYSVEFNSDGRVLAVAANTPNGPFIYIFDGFTFHPSYPQQPFPLQSIRLVTNNAAKLTAFEWNPCIPEMFASSTTDGLTTIQYSLNNPKSYSILGNQTLKSAVTCISWSPKGKQLTVGDAEGKIHQLKPELVSVRALDGPTTLVELGNPPYRCVGICWLSTTEWAVAHSTATNFITLSILTAKKNQNPAWESWSGVLPPLSDPKLPRSVNFLPLFDWQFVLATSTCLTNAIAFGNNGTVWKPWELPEPFVINTPLSTSHRDTFIVGSGFDFTATSPVIIERDGTQVPPQPIIYTLTSDGILLLYNVTSLNPARPSLNKPVEPCDLNATKNGEQPPGFQSRAGSSSLNPSQPVAATTPIKQQPAATSLFGTPAIPNLFSCFAKPNTILSTPPTTMQNTTTQNTASTDEEAEKKRKEAELKAAQAAEEQERQKRQAEEEQKRRAAAEAESQRQKAAEEEEAKRKQQISVLEANFKTNLDGLVSKLNEYARAVDALRAYKMKLMQNIKLNVEFDGHLDPMLKSIEYVSIISNDLSESLSRLRQVTNSVQRSAKESQQFLNQDTKELATPEWVLELSDDLDELEQREFIVVEKLQQAETKMEKIAKLLKEGRTKIHQKNQLTPEQQQKLEKDSKTMLIFVRKLWERIKKLRHDVREINDTEKVRQAKQAIRSAGGVGENEVSFLNESDVNLDISGQNASILASELISSISLIDSKRLIKDGSSESAKTNNIPRLLRLLDASAARPPKLVNVVPIDQLISIQKPPKETNSTILKPKVAEAQKALIEQLMKVQSPRASIISNVPATPPRQPLSLFGNKPAEAAVGTVPQQPAVSTPPQQKSIFGSGNISLGTPVTTPLFGNISAIGQPKTSTPKPLFGPSTTGTQSNIFSPQQSASPIFSGTPTTSVFSPLATTAPKATDDTAASEGQKRKAVAEEEQKKKDAAEAEAKKKAAEEQAERKKKEAEEKAKKEAEERERLEKEAEEKKRKEAEEAKQKAEEEEKKKAAAEEEAQKQAAEEEAKKKQEVAAAATVTATPGAPISFSFKPSASATPTVAAAAPLPASTSTAPINFSFKPAATTTVVAKSEANADIGMEDDGLDSALAGTAICSPSNTGSAFGNGTTSGFSSFGGGMFGQKQQQTSTTQNANPFGGGGFSSTAATGTTNNSPFGSGFGSNVKNPFGGGATSSTSTGSAFGSGSNTAFSSFGNKPSTFGGAFSSQQQPTTPQKNPFGATSAFGSPSTGSTPFGSGGGFAQTAKSPFAAVATTGSGFSSFGNKPAAPSQNTSSTFGGTSAFGGGSAFGSNTSPFAAASGSAFGGGSAFGQATKSPFASAASNTTASTASAFGGGAGFSSFANKSGGFGALAQQATSNNPQNTSSFGSTSAFGSGGSAFGSPRQ